MLTAAKSSLVGKRMPGKMFEGEMLIRILLTTLLQMFCTVIPKLLSKVSEIKTISRGSQALMGYRVIQEITKET